MAVICPRLRFQGDAPVFSILDAIKTGDRPFFSIDGAGRAELAYFAFPVRCRQRRKEHRSILGSLQPGK